MELAGNEKKIQALFCELKLEDERIAPAFTRVWNAAQPASRTWRRSLKTSFVVATAVLIITLCSVVLWSGNPQEGQQRNPDVAGRSTTPVPIPAPHDAKSEPKQLVVDGALSPVRFNHRARILAARRRAELAARNVVILKAVAVSSWQSPTATLMQSPADDVLTSLPEFNRSVDELKSFLPETPR